MVTAGLQSLRQRTMHAEPGVRYHARRLYHEHRDSSGASSPGADPTQPLTAQLWDRSPAVRWRASRRCQERPDPALIKAASDRLEYEPDAWVRAELVRVVARRGLAAAAALASCLHDPDERVRSNAMEALTAMKAPLPMAQVVELSRAPHHRARAAALIALAQNGVDVFGNVWEMLMSDKPWLRSSAEYVVRTLRSHWESQTPA